METQTKKIIRKIGLLGLVALAVGCGKKEDISPIEVEVVSECSSQSIMDNSQNWTLYCKDKEGKTYLRDFWTDYTTPARTREMRVKDKVINVGDKIRLYGDSQNLPDKIFYKTEE